MTPQEARDAIREAELHLAIARLPVLHELAQLVIDANIPDVVTALRRSKEFVASPADQTNFENNAVVLENLPMMIAGAIQFTETQIAESRTDSNQ